MTGGKLTIGSGQPVIVANEISKGMRGLLAKMPDAKADAILDAWLTVENEIIVALSKEVEEFVPPVLQPTEAEAWRGFLLAWRKKAEEENKDFKEAIGQAAYEIPSAVLNYRAEQVKEAASGGASPVSTSSGSSSSGSGTSSGSGSPLHERRMNHIYHHHEIRMLKVERIRARR